MTITKPDKQTLILLRHGATYATENRLYCGSSDIPLTLKGKAALERICAPKDAIYISSGMIRCNQTLKRCFGEVPYTVMRELRETDFGIFELHSYDELKDTPEYQRFIEHSEHEAPPGGESPQAVRERVMTALSSIIKLQRNACIVTHGGVISLIMAELFKNEARNRYEWQPQPGKGYRLELSLAEFEKRYYPL